ncbi:MAG: TolC family protein [Planctomycetota bacterium]
MLHIIYRRFLVVGCAVSCLFMAGCMSGHKAARDYYSPALYEDHQPGPDSDTTRQPVTAKNEAQKTAAILEKAQWSLQDCVDLAVANEERLKIQGEAYYQTKWLYYQALASWLPAISLEAANTNYDSGAPGTFLDKQEYWLKVRQPIFNSGRELIGLANSEQLSALRKYELKQARDVLILAVADSFYQALSLRNESATLESLLAYTQNYSDMVKARVEAQITSRKDALLAEAAIYDIKARLARTNNLLDNARLNLQLLVGAPLPAELADNAAMPGLAPISGTAYGLAPSNQESVITALANRTDVKVAEQQIKLAEAEANLAKGGFLPQINLDWTRYLHTETSSLAGLDWTLLLSASIPLDNGGRYAKVKEANSKLRQAGLAKDKLLKSLRNDVEKAYRDLQAIELDIEAREKGLAAAKETADIVIEEYRIGTATNVEVLFINNSFEQARIALDKSRIDLKLAYLRLKFALGLLAKEFQQ